VLIALAFVAAVTQATNPQVIQLSVRGDDRSVSIDITPAATRIRSLSDEPRQILLPMSADKASDLIRTPKAPEMAPPRGTAAVSCADGPNGCAAWTLAPGAVLDLSTEFVRTFAQQPVRILVLDPSGKVLSVTAVTLLDPATPTIILGTGGFVGAATGSAPFIVWQSSADKRDRPDAVLVIDNQADTAFQLFFLLDVPTDPHSGRRPPLVDSADGLRLQNCPMMPGVCGAIDVPARRQVLIPAKLLDSYAPSSTVHLVARTVGGIVPPSDVSVISLDPPPDAGAGPSRSNIPRREFNGDAGAVVALDNTGIADWDYLNPRRAPLIVQDQWTVFGFENRTSDRTVVVAVPVNARTASRAGRAAAADRGLAIEPCKHVDGQQCAILTLAPGTSRALSLDDLVDPDRPVIRFLVSFFDEDVTPAQTIGYARTSLAAYESPSRTAWGLLAKISGSTDPFLPRDATGAAKRITSDAPFETLATSSMQGLARLNTKPTLGDRADADIDLLFEQAALGGKDARLPTAGAPNDLNAVSVPKYKFTIYGQDGIQFAFGKFQFLDTVLLSEGGEGFRFSWRNFGVGRILKRESANNIADVDNHDHDVWIAQANNLLTDNAGSLRSINLTALYGHDRSTSSTSPTGVTTEVPDRTYWTAGAEAFFAVPELHLQGSTGVFHSRRRVDPATAAVPDGDGTMGYLTATLSVFGGKPDAKARTVQRSVGVLLAGGSADGADTPTKNDGYLGESAKFSQDSLFLAALDPLIGVQPAFAPNTLSGKGFLGFTFTDQTFSPLDWIAGLLQIPSTDIVSRRTTLKYNAYRYTNLVLGVKHPGDEFGVEFAVETPRGVRVSLAYNRFFTAAGFDSLFPKDPWRLTAFIQLQL
jgi:hypothetical protein